MADKLTKEALAYQRRRLKVRLWRERTVPCHFDTEHSNRLVSLPKCDYSGRTISYPNAAVMHEWLIKRSDLPVEKQHLIMHEYNCVLVDYHCHEQHGQTREFKLRCARAQYKRYGRDEIVAWVESLSLRQHVEVPDELETFMAVHDGILDGSIEPGEPEPLPYPKRYIFYTDDY